MLKYMVYSALISFGAFTLKLAATHEYGEKMEYKGVLGSFIWLVITVVIYMVADDD